MSQNLNIGEATTLFETSSTSSFSKRGEEIQHAYGEDHGKKNDGANASPKWIPSRVLNKQ